MKIQNKKITILILSIISIVFASGCKKFLDRQPLQGTVDDIKVGAMESKAVALYGAIRNSKSAPFCGDGFQNIPWVAMNGFRSDDAEIIADPGAAAWRQTYDNFQYTKDDWGAGLYWDKHYTFIGLCNDGLDEAAKNNYNDPASLVNIGEIKFFRAFAYFDLVRTYGEVPKIDFKINAPSDAHKPKSTVAQIYDFIEQDLTEAAAVLPPTWEPKFKGRLTLFAARAMHAKVSLYRQKWAQALSLAQSVINSNQYSLTDEYYKIYKTSGELNQESIFEIQARKTAGDGDTYWSRLGQCQGVRGSGTWDLGWGWNTPTANLVNAYEAGDKRRSATILFSNQFDGGPSTGGYGATLPNLTNALYWNKKVYNQFSDYQAAGLGTPNNEAQNTWVNQRVLRYGDVLLMAAEAANEVGGATNLANATAWINLIRNRAGLSNTTATTQATLRNVIKQERRFEFALEYERFYDLVRWGDATTVLSANGYQNKHRFYPIPNSALNANPALTQNPEWP